MDRGEIYRLGRIRKFDAPGIPKPSERRRRSDCDDNIEVVVSSGPSDQVYSFRFSHQGCLLSRASMNALMESIQDLPKKEAQAMVEEYRKMVKGQPFFNLPERLLLFRKFTRFPSRISCLLLGCDQLLKAMKDN